MSVNNPLYFLQDSDATKNFYSLTFICIFVLKSLLLIQHFVKIVHSKATVRHVHVLPFFFFFREIPKLHDFGLLKQKKHSESEIKSSYSIHANEAGEMGQRW